MSDFIWPSDLDRAENDELNRVCEQLEAVMDERDAARKEASRAREQACEFETELDAALEREIALAAHVELLERSVSEFAAYAGVPGVLHADTKRAYEVLNSKPTTSLTRRDLIKQAEILEETAQRLVDSFGRSAPDAFISDDFLRRDAANLRQRAKALDDQSA